jgi:hypothetical protein
MVYCSLRHIYVVLTMLIADMLMDLLLRFSILVSVIMEHNLLQCYQFVNVAAE